MRHIGVNRLTTFGYSLATGVDVDGNQFNGMDWDQTKISHWTMISTDCESVSSMVCDQC